jgi:hypothetical protein
VEDLGGEASRRTRVPGPGQEVAVDAVDLGVVEEGEGLAVAGGGTFEQGALARQLGGDVAVAAGAGGRVGVLRTAGSEGQVGAFSG